MSVSTLESENAQPVAQTQNSELIYRLEDRPPLPQTLFAACQHLLAMFVAVITPALLICQALGLPAFKLRPGVRLAPGCCLFRAPASTLLPR